MKNSYVGIQRAVFAAGYKAAIRDVLNEMRDLSTGPDGDSMGDDTVVMLDKLGDAVEGLTKEE